MYLLITLLICLLSFQLSAQNNYTMSDLEVLQERKNFEEFFAHAKDIRPGERNKPWIAMVQNMSEEYLRHTLKRPFVSHKDLTKIDSLADWSIVRENPGFLILRNKFGVKFFEYCFEHELDKERCYREALNFIKKTPSQFQMATDIGRIIYQHRLKLPTSKSIGMNLWPFFEKMATSPISEFYCHKDYFRNEVMIQITRNIEKSSQKEIKQKINETLHADCWQKLKPYLKDQLESNQDTLSSNAFFLLSARQDLTAFEEQRFLILYLLNYPTPGEIFSKAWAMLQGLDTNYELREKLLAELKAMDPIPGNIFQNFKEKRALVIIKVISQKFPEYLDLYSQTCLSYLEGKDFPNGNPTPKCRKLFELADKYTLLPKPVIKRYQAARSFDVK